jgi:hypothetical protein
VEGWKVSRLFAGCNPENHKKFGSAILLCVDFKILERLERGVHGSTLP